ncbi:MAG: flagellar motor switch protein FliG, partial [Roseovarius sp.]|nr:flagellar motor switch protein FliG [Roseovarius sp.]
MGAPLARIEGPTRHGAAAHLTRAQKAAIIVRFLLNEGTDVPLTDLPDGLQARLTTQMGSMRYVDRGTLADVVAEFAQELEGMGLTFPRGMAGA